MMSKKGTEPRTYTDRRTNNNNEEIRKAYLLRTWWVRFIHITQQAVVNDLPGCALQQRTVSLPRMIGRPCNNYTPGVRVRAGS